MIHQSEQPARRAVWGEAVIAESATTTNVDGYEYFPADAVDWSRLEPSPRTSVCPWKGPATYFDVVDGERRLEAAAWTYADPSRAAQHIKGHIAFWRGVDIVPGG